MAYKIPSFYSLFFFSCLSVEGTFYTVIVHAKTSVAGVSGTSNFVFIKYELTSTIFLHIYNNYITFFLRISDILLLISVLTVMSLQGKGDCQALDISRAIRFEITGWGFFLKIICLSKERNLLKH